MALAEILAAIRADGAAEVAAIELAAARDAAATLATARAEAARLEAEAAAGHGERLDLEVLALEDAARRRGAQARAAALERWVAELRRVVAEGLAGARERADYPGVLRASLRAAWTGCPGASVVRVDPRDLSLARELTEELGLPARVEGRAEGWGGAVVVSDCGRVVVDDTLERRHQRCEPALRLAAAAAAEGVEPP